MKDDPQLSGLCLGLMGEVLSAKFLDVCIDHKLALKEHMSSVCKEVSVCT